MEIRYPLNRENSLSLLKAVDSSGNNNHALIYRPVFINDHRGYSNSALRFDGLESRVHLPDTVKFGHTNFTISLGFLMRYGHNFHLIGTRIGDDKRGFDIFCDYNDAKVYFRHGNGTSISSLSGNLPLLPSDWYFISCVYNATNGIKQIYKSDSGGTSLLSQIEFPFNMVVSTNDLVVGNYWNGPWHNTPCIVSGIYIHTSALSSSAINDLYVNWWNGTFSGASGMELSLYAPNEVIVSESHIPIYVLDESGNDNHGMVNGPYLDSDNVNRPFGSYYFDGIDDYIDTNVTTDISANDFSIIICYNGIDPNYLITQARTLSPISSNFIIGLNNALFWFRGVTLGDINSIKDGSWHHIVMTWNSGTLKYKGYLDGINLGESNVISGNSSDGTIKIGCRGNVTSAFSQGNISNVAIYNRILTDSDISILYNDWLVGNIPSITNNRVLYYPMNLENSSTLKVRGTGMPDIDGTVTGAKLSSIHPYRTNECYFFDVDGNNTIVTGLTDNSIFTGPNGFTLSAWIKPLGLGDNNNGRILDKSTNATGGGGFTLCPSVDNTIIIRLDSGAFLVTSDNSITIGLWHHVITSILPDGIGYIYIDGIEKGSGTTEFTSRITTTNPLTIGNRSGAVDGGFGGYISDVKIYDYAMDAGEAAYRFNLERTKGEPIAGLVFHAPLDGLNTSGTTIFDISGNENHGTVIGATLTADRFGRANRAYSFDGLDDYISIPPQTLGSFSINIKAKNILTNSYFFSKGTNSNNQFFIRYLDENNGKLIVTMLIAGSHVFNFSSENCGLLSDNNWHTITVQSDRTSVEIWSDGIKRTIHGTPIITSTADTISGNLWLMRFRNTSIYYTGIIEDLRIYNRMLSETEILQLYYNGLTI